MSDEILVEDRGGTKSAARRSRVEDDGTITPIGKVSELRALSQAPFPDVLERHCDELEVDPANIAAVVIAAAGDHNSQPGKVLLPHYYEGHLDVEAALERCGLSMTNAIVLNDLEAEAGIHFLPTPPAARIIRPGKPTRAQRRWDATISNGTGVGVVLHREKGCLIRPTELGNTVLGTPTSDDVWKHWPALRKALLAKGHTFLRAEGLFGGDGVEACYEVVTGKRLSAAEIGTRLRAEDKDMLPFATVWAEAYGEYCQSTLLAGWPPRKLWLSGFLKNDHWLLTGNPGFLNGFNRFRSNPKALDQVQIGIFTDTHTVLAGAEWHATRFLARKKKKK